MKDVVNLGAAVGKESTSNQCKSTLGLKIPTEEEIGSMISKALRDKFGDGKLNISVASDNHFNFNKRDPITNVLLFVQVSYKMYRIDDNKSVLVGVLSPVLKRFNSLTDSRSKYLVLPATTSIFFMTEDSERANGKLNEAIDFLAR